MYSNDSKIKHVLAIFFAIGITNELASLFHISMPIISLLYCIGLIAIIFNYNNLKETKYLWEPALGFIGIFALIYIFFYFINFKADFFKKLSQIITLLVWIKCLKYLDNNQDDDNEINIGSKNLKNV